MANAQKFEQYRRDRLVGDKSKASTFLISFRHPLLERRLRKENRVMRRACRKLMPKKLPEFQTSSLQPYKLKMLLKKTPNPDKINRRQKLQIRLNTLALAVQKIQANKSYSEFRCDEIKNDPKALAKFIALFDCAGKVDNGYLNLFKGEKNYRQRRISSGDLSYELKAATLNALSARAAVGNESQVVEMVKYAINMAQKDDEIRRHAFEYEELLGGIFQRHRSQMKDIQEKNPELIGQLLAVLDDCYKNIAKSSLIGWDSEQRVDHAKHIRNPQKRYDVICEIISFHNFSAAKHVEESVMPDEAKKELEKNVRKGDILKIVNELSYLELFGYEVYEPPKKEGENENGGQA